MDKQSHIRGARERNDTEHKLLEAALSEFAGKGFAGANVNRISLAAGFAKGTIYNYFPSKRALMLGLIDEIATDHTCFIAGHVQEESEPVDQLQQFFHAGYRFVELFPSKARVAIATVFGHDEEFRERLFQAYLSLFSMVMDGIIKRGVEHGTFRVTDQDVTTALLMSLYLGSCSLLDKTGKIWLEAGQVAQFAFNGLDLDFDPRTPPISNPAGVKHENWKQW